ncbi:dihydropteroate synthase [Halarchaeum rubridurum]|uniref:Probable bifunctional folylpolyglutamate synthase/dihydropteroate synthase n=1 Tax=Halarchaeum rubridurum TaxID=489911 RepID=A0A830G1Y5_9EURY|nr:dihydropteroate synthase [Halarchaeum rubridurum]MBP1955311.1 dihydropteroate synthase [Halarchaeum rubridurum]GGM71245.1 dihydropteroate synthase [Halarchaeum rubridurum]
MRYDEAANFLLDLRRFSPRAGTEGIADLLSTLDDPHRGPTYVQVAGSNGKGSTARMVEAALRETDLDVGLYTSPHFDDLRERIRVNGRKIPESAVADYTAAIEEYVTEHAAVGDSPTFFETVTGMALWHFGEMDVDVAILEVGIGGRFDATSVVDPSAACVTSVSLEHTDVLGDTVAEIAREKAAVAPADAPLVTATTGEARETVREVAGDVVTVGESDDDDVRVAYGGPASTSEASVTLTDESGTLDARIPLFGRHQATNAGIAATLVRQLVDVDDATLARGLRKAHWPGRFEVMGDDPLTVLDGAHNPGACAAVADTLADFDYDDLHLVVGAMNDKDHVGMAAALPTADHVWACRPDTGRAEDEAALAAAFREAGAGEVSTRRAVESALDRALDAAGPDDCVLVAGSLYTVAEARRRWTRVSVPKRADDLAESRAHLERAHVTPAGAWRMRGKGVHRVVRAHVQKRQAQYLKEELLSLGGECAVSGLNEQARGTVDVVMMGTLAQFKRLCGKLDGQPYGLSLYADELRETLDIETAGDDADYPWTGEGTAVMGILNVTPDSFHDGGEYEAIEDAVARAERMVADGADIVDVGGESTRPGADPVPAATEIERIVPVIERIADLDCLISVDTMKAEVGRAALEAGADVLNDVTGLEDPEMRFVAAEYDAPLIVMHSLNAPVEPGEEPEYDDVVEDVIDELRERVLLAEKAGLPREKIVVDPGLGFAKTAGEEFEILHRTDEFHALGCPVLIGHSHKSMFGALGDGASSEHATVAGTAIAAERGADVVRVHDVPENVAAVRTVEATRRGAGDDGGEDDA